MNTRVRSAGRPPLKGVRTEMKSQELQESTCWQPQWWRNKELRHMPSYSGQDVMAVTDRLASLTGLVDLGEIQNLKMELRAVSEGRMFALQMGDTEERFKDASPSHVNARMRNLESVRKYVAFMLGKPVLPIGLVAGNYATSRPHPTEVIDGITLPSFFGEMVNDASPNPWGRRPDANRMLWAYEAARASLETIRRNRFKAYTSHEGANLHFEEVMVRKCTAVGGFYASSAHLLWLESDNIFSGSCHLEFFRGILNPIGVRVGPSATPAELLSTYTLLNPEKEPGKIIFVTSLGKNMEPLECFVRVLQDAKAPVVWMCDPMRENATLTESGVSVVMSDVICEVENTVAVHVTMGSWLGGLHLETSHEKTRERGRYPSLDFQQTLQVCSNLVRAYVVTQ